MYKCKAKYICILKEYLMVMCKKLKKEKLWRKYNKLMLNINVCFVSQ